MLTKGKGYYNVELVSPNRFETLKKVYVLFSTLTGGQIREKEAELLAAIETCNSWEEVEERMGISPGNRRVMCTQLKKKGILTREYEVISTLQVVFDDNKQFNINIQLSERPENTGTSEKLHDIEADGDTATTAG